MYWRMFCVHITYILNNIYIIHEDENLKALLNKIKLITFADIKMVFMHFGEITPINARNYILK